MQKGPLVFGSAVFISELTSDLATTGFTHLTRTSDSLGSFTLLGGVGSPIVDLLGDGFYFDEIAGTLSSSPIKLSAFANLSVSSSPIINMLTTLQTPRLKQLILRGASFPDAYAQSQSDLLASFGIDVSLVEGMTNLYEMSLNGTTDSNAVMLAVSSILLRIATADGAPATTSAQLSILLSSLAYELEQKGAIESPAFVQARAQASRTVDTRSIASNLVSYYASLGAAIQLPPFQDWIDQDNSGVLPQRSTLPVTAFTLTPLRYVTGASWASVWNGTFFSNNVTVAGLPAGVHAKVYWTVTCSVRVPREITLLKNGAPLSGKSCSSAITFASVVNGDVLRFSLGPSTNTAPYFAATNISVALAVGARSGVWNVSLPRIPFTCCSGQESCGGALNDPVVCAALGDLFWATNGLGWVDSYGWKRAASGRATNYCIFTGFDQNWDEYSESSATSDYDSDDPGCEITSLNLHANNLFGSLPSTLTSLSSLTSLDLSLNSLSGSIPLALMPGLEVLNLVDNALSGQIPTSLCALQNLTDLLLGNSGMVAPQLECCGSTNGCNGFGCRADFTWQGANTFSSSIPACLASMPILHNLQLQNLKLNGSIPFALFNLGPSWNTWIFERNWNGVLPCNPGDWGCSVEAYLSNVWTWWPGTLNLQNNSLTGDLYSTTAITPGLHVDISSNRLAGMFPEALCGIVTWTNTQGNNWCGPWLCFSGNNPYYPAGNGGACSFDAAYIRSHMNPWYTNCSTCSYGTNGVPYEKPTDRSLICGVLPFCPESLIIPELYFPYTPL